MPKYWRKRNFSLGSFSEVGQKQKTYKKKEREKERAKVGKNNANATSGGASKPPGPILFSDCTAMFYDKTGREKN